MMLQDKIAVITGAAGRIGRATTAVFQREGATVVGIDVAREDTACDLTLQADLSDEAQVIRTFAAIRDRYSRIDVLFSNAGVALGEDQSVVGTTLETWNAVLRTNLTSMFLSNKHAIPFMIENGGGAIINTASLLGTMGSAESQIAYTASKGGVLAISAEIGVEFAKQGIRVNTISPGPVETPLFTDLVDEVGRQRRLVHAPTGRFTRAEEIAESVAFLASDRASHINATDLKIDGGMSIAYVTPE